MMRRIIKLLTCALALLPLSILPLNVSAHGQSGEQDPNVEAALHWLELAQLQDGSVVTDDDLATTYQATSESLKVFTELDSLMSNKLAAASVITNAPQSMTTEGLARALMALDDSAQSYDHVQTALLLRQNRDGGFGDFDEYDSNALDTALALIALQSVGADVTVAGNAVSFLVNAQSGDGAFTTYINDNSPVVTAIVLQSIRSYIYTYNISSALSSAVEFLYQSQGVNGWGESYWETATILSSLIPVTSDITRYQAAVDYLRSGQSAAGDWEGSAYATALAALALQMLSAVEIPADPEKAVLAGTVVEKISRNAIAGLQIDLVGTGGEIVEINANGGFTISNIDPEAYVVEYSAPGYLTASQGITLARGQFANLGTITLTIAPTTALITGIVTDESGAAIAGAVVTVTVAGKPFNTVSNIDGGYQLVSDAGRTTIEISADRYRTAIASADLVAASELVFSPALALSSDTLPDSSTISGVIVDEQGTPIQGANAVLGQGESVLTDAQGRFDIAGLDGGETDLAFSKDGYETVKSRVIVPDNAKVNIGYVTLRIRLVLPVTSVSGRVLDTVTGNAVAAATVDVAGTVATADSNGFYRVENISLLDFSVSSSAVGYLSAQKQVVLAEHSDLQLDINLRQSDLGSVSIDSISTDSGTYASYHSVYISATLTNETAVAQGVRLFAKITDETGNIVAEFSGSFIPPLDPQSGPEELLHYQRHFEDAIEGFEPSEKRTVSLEQWWNTMAVPPGSYTVTIQAFDSFSSSLVSERSTIVEVIDTKAISLELKTSPSYVLLNDMADIEITANVFNGSNVKATISFDYRLLDPAGNELTQGNARFVLDPDDRNSVVVVSQLNFSFVNSGTYRLEVDDLVGASVEELTAGSVFVPPSVRLRTTQQLQPYEVAPLEGTSVISKIKIEGVDGE